MIIEIALGIVLAWIIISLLPLIVAGGLLLIALGIVVLVVAVLVFHWTKAALFIIGALSFAFAIGIPYTIGERLLRRVPRLRLAVDGLAPFDSWKMLPQRLALMVPYVFGLVALGIAILVLGLSGVDWVERALKPS